MNPAITHSNIQIQTRLNSFYKQRVENLIMATLQKFKLFATPCGVAQSPTQSPRTSPIVIFRRPKTTLQTLLWLNRSSRRKDSPLLKEHSSEKKGRNSLKELFVSSPPREEVEEKLHGACSTTVLGSVAVENPGWLGFRYRSLLKRKAWRPLLLTIHE